MQMRFRSIARFAVQVGLGATLLWVAPLASGQQALAETADKDSSHTLPEGNEKPVEAPKKETSSKKTDSMAEVYSSANEGTGLGSLTRNFLEDQKRIWTGAAHLKFTDAQWIVPIATLSTGLFVTDAEYSKHLSKDPNTISRYKNISDVGVGALIGGAGGMWVLGHMKHNEHWSETGFLAGEAAIGSLVAVEGLKYSLRRERPYQGNGSGAFFQPGGTSFPSEHSAAAWAVAGVIAHEYPGPLTKIAVYGLASLVSISRVRAHQHFNSDVFIGGLIGNMVAQDVYTRHFNPELGGTAWRSMRQTVKGDGPLQPSSYGSPYVPLDSWVYPVLDRLYALGQIRTVITGQRPWTRLECARLTEEAADSAQAYDSDSSKRVFGVAALETEFTNELKALEGGTNEQAQVESVYTRMTGISGQPLNDSYHFGQTIVNDFGRPYEEGFNNVTGLSTFVIEGRFSLYMRGEYQHAPSASAYSLPVRQEIATVDVNPLQPAVPIAETNQFKLLDSYIGTAMNNWQFTFGKQSLWWGAARGGAFLFSDNAEPIYMFRASQTAPVRLPWIFRYLGPMKLDFFFGKLSGNQFPPRPLIHGEKISFQITPNLELGFSRTSEFGGVGRPLTLGAVWESYVAYSTSVGYAANRSPGKRTGGFDLSYKIPFVRNWLTIYADSLTSDDPSPIDAPRRASLNAGLYMPRLPGLPKLDLRFESVYTDTPTGNGGLFSPKQGGQYVYWELFYHDLYTNKNNLIGNWIGRDGSGYQAWSTYWFNMRNNLQFGFRHAKVDGAFITGGETLNDGSVSLNLQVRSDWSVSTGLQYERWVAPLLSPTHQTNWTSSVGITYWPKSWSK
jgi:membrane-associated phospholipid phosphatase